MGPANHHVPIFSLLFPDFFFDMCQNRVKTIDIEFNPSRLVAHAILTETVSSNISSCI